MMPASAGHHLVTKPPEFADRLFLTTRQQMRVALHQREIRPAALDLKPQEILVERVMPAGPAVPTAMRAELPIEPGAPDRAPPCRLYLTAITAPILGIGLTPARRTRIGAEDRTITMREISERDDGA